MAKKTATNAVKKIDEQIKDLESKSKKSTNNTVKTSSVKKSTTKKTTTATKSTTKKSSSTRDKIVVAPKKKTTSTSTKKTTTTKSVRDKVVVTPKKKSTTKTIEEEKIKNDLKSTKRKKEEVKVVAPRYRKKDLVEEVNKILGIEEEEKVEAPKFIQEEKPLEEVEVSAPKFIDEEKTAEINTKEVVKEFLEKEDKKELEKTSNFTIDDVDVIKFDKPAKKKSNLKKKSSDEDLKLDKPINLDEIDKVEEYKIVEDIEKDVPKKKQEFTRKRKGKGYVVEIKKKPTYTELESDLRSLYDEVEDVVDDFDKTASIPIQQTTKPKKKFTLFGKKQAKKKIEKTQPVVQKPVKKTRVVKDSVVIADTLPNEKPSLLDHVSQKVLNFFLTVLFIIFFLMVIAFIGFVIYVSTF